MFLCPLGGDWIACAILDRTLNGMVDREDSGRWTLDTR